MLDSSTLSPASIGRRQKLYVHFTGSPYCVNLIWSYITVIGFFTTREWTWDGLATYYVGNGDG